MKIVLLDPKRLPEPEVVAMLQAFYSRSPMPIEERLTNLLKDGEGETAQEKIKSAMKRYYVDYGHASIGEMGGCTVFIEDVSMLAAKAIQDSELYVGQECSTRYIDFSVQPFIQPWHRTSEHQEQGYQIHESLRQIYIEYLPKVIEYVKTKYSPDDVLSGKIPEEKREAAFNTTCKAIAFDICRGLLPAGASTSLAWTANFRVFNDHLRYLAYHPVEEVRQVARKLYADLSEKFPNSFKSEKLNPEDYVDDYNRYYLEENQSGLVPRVVDDWITGVPMQTHGHYKYRSVDNYAAMFEIKGPLDFGSYRDLQRHRHGMNRMPLLTLTHGIHPFYQKHLYDSDPALYKRLLDAMVLVYYKMQVTPEELQYYIPMGYQVPTHLIWSLGQLRYVMNLRTKTSVHPTLRSYMHSVYDHLQPEFAECMVVDRSPDYQASDRGEQTIKKRET